MKENEKKAENLEKQNDEFQLIGKDQANEFWALNTLSALENRVEAIKKFIGDDEILQYEKGVLFLVKLRKQI